jgi:hypothetical protein
MSSQNRYQTIKCKNCRCDFVWSEDEQRIYEERKLAAPIYCPICRGMMGARNRDVARERYEGK